MHKEHFDITGMTPEFCVLEPPVIEPPGLTT